MADTGDAQCERVGWLRTRLYLREDRPISAGGIRWRDQASPNGEGPNQMQGLDPVVNATRRRGGDRALQGRSTGAPQLL